MSMAARNVAPGVEVLPLRTKTLPPADSTCCFVLGSNDCVLVDPGTPYDDEADLCFQWIQGLHRGGLRPLAVVLTHHHQDHSSGARALSHRLGIPVWAHALAAERLPHLVVERRLNDGDVLHLGSQRWQVLHTPGHAWGHVCLFEAATASLVAGDMVTDTGTVFIGRRDGDGTAYLEQLARLEALRPRRVFPAHGPPEGLGPEVLRMCGERRRARERQVLTCVRRSGPTGTTVDELLDRAYGALPLEALEFVRSSLLAHLEKLHRDGSVSLSVDRWALPGGAR